jgi:hypothetical protein
MQYMYLKFAYIDRIRIVNCILSVFFIPTFFHNDDLEKVTFQIFKKASEDGIYIRAISISIYLSTLSNFDNKINSE